MKRFSIYFDKLHALDDLPLQVYARVIKALVVYEETGEKQFTEDPVANMALKLLYLDADAIAYFDDSRSVFLSGCGKKGAQKRWAKSKFADEQSKFADEQSKFARDDQEKATDDQSKFADDCGKFAQDQVDFAENIENNGQEQPVQPEQPGHEAIEKSKFALQPDGIKRKEKKIKESKGSSARERKKAQADKGRIIPPTMEMVDEFGREKGYDLSECTRFYYYYGSKDWFVGKTQMKNWHMSLANWMADKNYGSYQRTKQQQAEDPYSGYTRL